jgi:hypothetical protein
MDKQAFINRVRSTLGTASALFEDEPLRQFRDAEIESLSDKYIRRYVTDASNRAGHGIFYPMPTTISKVRRIEFWDVDPEANVTALLRGRAQLWEDRSRPGYVRIEDAASGDYSGNVIYLIGEGDYTDITQCLGTIADVVLYGTCIRALEAQIMSRAFTRASQAASRRSDVTLASMGMLLNRLDLIYQSKIRRARKSVATVAQ